MKYFEFQSVLFNFHDVMLLMTTLQCLFFAALLYITNTSKEKSTFFLVAFLIAHALIPLNELFMWGAGFKHTARMQWPNLHFIPGIAYYLDGVLLYFCIKFLVFKGVHLKRFDLIHFIPAMVYLIFLVVTFHSQSDEQKQHMLLTESYVYGSGYVVMEWLSKVIRILYCAACFIMLKRYSNLLKERKANIEKGHIHWLNSLVIGFMAVMTAELLLITTKAINLVYPLDGGVFEHIGLTVNYASFVLVNLLFFLAVRDFFTFEQIEDEEANKTVVDNNIVNPKMALEVDKAMKESKSYMDPDITLEKLADSLSLQSKDLSMLINRHLGVNFYEFINKYRIDEAKKMLVSEEFKNTTITDIYFAVGFNSKSVFYTFFKKFENMTPLQYKQSHQK